jgi:hypothetical protein
LLSFIDLLSNTRNDLAMLRILGSSEPVVPFSAFKNTQASLYQQMFSFFRKLQLGGKGYQDTDSPLEAYKTQLHTLSTCFEALHVCMLEDLAGAPVSVAGLKKLLQIVSRQMLGCGYARVDGTSWRAVAAHLATRFEQFLQLPSVKSAPSARTWPTALRLFVDLMITTGVSCTSHAWTAGAWFGDRPCSPSVAHAFPPLVQPSPPPPNFETPLRPGFTTTKNRDNNDTDDDEYADVRPPLVLPPLSAEHLMQPATPLSPVKLPGSAASDNTAGKRRRKRPFTNENAIANDGNENVDNSESVPAKKKPSPPAAAVKRKTLQQVQGQSTLAGWLKPA